MAAVLSTRAKLAMIRGDPAGTRRDVEQSLAAFRALGDGWGQPQTIEWLGAAEAAIGDHARASRLHTDGLHMAEDLGLWPQAADALSWLGRAAMRSGDLAQAGEFPDRAMGLAAGQSYQPGQVFAEMGLGQTARLQGRLDVAEAHMRNMLETSQRIGSGPEVARTIALSELVFIAEQRGDTVTARSWHLQCLTAAQELGDPQVVALAPRPAARPAVAGPQARMPPTSAASPP